MRKLKTIEDRNEEQWKAIKDQGENELDAIKKNNMKNNKLKHDETKNIVLLKDRLKELIESYPKLFNTFAKNKLNEFASKEEDIDCKKLSQEIFSYGFDLLGRYGTPERFLKNLVTNKMSINAANDDQRERNFVFNLMKLYNVSSFIKGSKI